jgi:hypothetical protein
LASATTQLGSGNVHSKPSLKIVEVLEIEAFVSPSRASLFETNMEIALNNKRRTNRRTNENDLTRFISFPNITLGTKKYIAYVLTAIGTRLLNRTKAEPRKDHHFPEGRLRQDHPSIPEWGHFRYNVLPDEMFPHRKTLERMVIADFAAVLESLDSASMKISDRSILRKSFMFATQKQLLLIYLGFICEYEYWSGEAKGDEETSLSLLHYCFLILACGIFAFCG